MAKIPYSSYGYDWRTGQRVQPKPAPAAAAVLQPAPAPAPPAPPAPPQSASFAAQIQNILTGLAGLPGVYNPERRSLAWSSAAGLNESGYSDWAGVEEAGRDPAGNIAYRVVQGPDGALYRQAYRGIEAAQNARGVLESSFTRRKLGEQKRELDINRAQAVRGFEGDQASSFQRQAEQWRQGANALGQARGDYRDWQAGQPVALETPGTPNPIPAAAPSAVSGSTPKPKPATGTPRVINVGQIQSPHQASNLALQHPGYDLRKRGGGRGFVLVRR